MRISYHAAQRFLERVINPKTFSKEDVYHAQAYLQRLLKDVVINSYKKKFVIPEFQHFLGVYQENVCRGYDLYDCNPRKEMIRFKR